MSAGTLNDLLHALNCSWDARLVALKNYYGSPGVVFPFAFLNPGGFYGDVKFWQRALEDYQNGVVR